MYFSLINSAAVFGPDGRRLTKAIDPAQEGFVIADIDPMQISLAKQLADPVGHYARPDLVKITFNTEEVPVVETKEKPASSITKKVESIEHQQNGKVVANGHK